jgi:DNA-binding NtrC family response regulator
MNKLLIVDDEQSVRYSFRKLLSASYHIIEASCADGAMLAMRAERPDLAIIDVEMPGRDGIELLKEIKDFSPATPVIIITAYGTGDRVIKAMKYGAYEYIEKPFDIPRLIRTIEDAMHTSAQAESRPAETGTPPPAKPAAGRHEMVGESPAIKEVFKLIGRVASSDATILVVGESGTGKELVARAIHKYSDRASHPFIAINCAAIPETLLESELFGYEKGAFTGADKMKTGRFEEANKGTLFLDEIGDMSLYLQSKLLRILQEGTFEKLGSSKTQRADVRIVAATNRSLENGIALKTFREDLYYRLKVITVSLPPLRMRKEDIPVLAMHFVEKHSANSRKKQVSIKPEAIEKLTQHYWPGNIRELENVIKRALILSKSNSLSSADFLDKPDIETLVASTDNPRLDLYLSHAISLQHGMIYPLVVSELEKDIIIWALARTAGNQVKAAKLLGISRVMLHERIEKYGLKPES